MKKVNMVDADMKALFCLCLLRILNSYADFTTGIVYILMVFCDI